MFLAGGYDTLQLGTNDNDDEDDDDDEVELLEPGARQGRIPSRATKFIDSEVIELSDTELEREEEEEHAGGNVAVSSDTGERWWA